MLSTKQTGSRIPPGFIGFVPGNTLNFLIVSGSRSLLSLTNNQNRLSAWSAVRIYGRIDSQIWLQNRLRMPTVHSTRGRKNSRMATASSVYSWSIVRCIANQWWGLTARQRHINMSKTSSRPTGYAEIGCWAHYRSGNRVLLKRRLTINRQGLVNVG